ncbi:class I SAM-dependent RNA methyltransferase [Candidatus Peregrinibacteria bacterium]|nr:class I SAM-dependent RNA methyltransferase [Candidatus Peregrinibacteria bacterium]
MNHTPNPKKNDILTLEITDLAFGGRGISRFEGRTVFINTAVPGDTVEVRVTTAKNRFIEAEVIKVISPSPDRIDPRCRHFSECGGCAWQMLTYDVQIAHKEKQVFSTVEHISGLSDFEKQPIMGCETPWFYRNKMEFSFGRDSEGKTVLGLHLAGRWYDIFDLEECFLGNPWNSVLVKVARDFCLRNGLSPYIVKENRGLLRSLIIREGKNTGEIMINLVISHEEFPKMNDFRDCMVAECAKIFDKKLSDAFLAESLPKSRLASLYLTRFLVKKGSRHVLKEELLYGSPSIHETLTVADKTLSFEIFPQSFFQPNTRQAQKLYTAALDLAGLSGTEMVYDLFCGTGTIGLFFAPHVQKVMGIEVNESGVSSARKNATANGISNIEFVSAPVEQWLKSVSSGGVASDSVATGGIPRPQVIIIDPPRAGLSPRALERILALGAERIVYVSCNPATFSRDARLFTHKNYRLSAVQPVDMFPQTPHIEMVGVFIAGNHS